MRKTSDGKMIFDDHEVEKLGKYFEGLKQFSAYKEACESMGFEYFVQKYGEAIITDEIKNLEIQELVFIKTEHQNLNGTIAGI